MNAGQEMMHERRSAAGRLAMLIEPMRHGDASCWLVLLGALDVMLTWLVLAKGGVEVNPIAREVIFSYGLPGAVAFKFMLTTFVIIVCEHVARHRPETARRLAMVCISIAALPVVVALLQLTAHKVVMG